MNPDKETASRPFGLALFTLLAALLALLGLLGALAMVFIALRGEPMAGLALRVPALGLVGIAWCVSAYGLWRARRWSITWCYLQFALIVAAALLSSRPGERIELGAVLVIGLAFAVNATLLAYLKMPEVRAWLSRD